MMKTSNLYQMAWSVHTNSLYYYANAASPRFPPHFAMEVRLNNHSAHSAQINEYYVMMIKRIN